MRLSRLLGGNMIARQNSDDIYLLDDIKAVKYLVDKGYQELRVILVGDGEYRKILEEFVARNKLSKYVSFKGYLRELGLSEVRSRCHIGLMCSQHETFNVTVEYMLSKMPGIGAISGGTKEIIENNETEFLYEPGDARDLSNKIECFINHKEKNNLFEEAAYESVKKKFSAERYGAEVYDLYREILEEKD